MILITFVITDNNINNYNNCQVRIFIPACKKDLLIYGVHLDLNPLSLA